MTRVRKSDLRKRWADPAVSASLLADADSFVRLGSLGRAVDLRGASIGMDGPLADFRLVGRDYENVDLSQGKGALIIRSGTVTRMRAEGFAFDRASNLAKATLVDCDLSRFTGRFDAVDVSFLRCSFSSGKFRGGFSEYGFTRCSFEGCDLTAALWANAFLKACRFQECTFQGTRFEGCYVAGLRLEGKVDLPSLLVNCDARSIRVNGLEASNAHRAV